MKLKLGESSISASDFGNLSSDEFAWPPEIEVEVVVVVVAMASQFRVQIIEHIICVLVKVCLLYVLIVIADPIEFIPNNTFGL